MPTDLEPQGLPDDEMDAELIRCLVDPDLLTRDNPSMGLLRWRKKVVRRLAWDGSWRDENFPDYESLYFRVESSNTFPDGEGSRRVRVGVLKYPDFSLNRESCNEANEVKLLFEDWEVAHFNVRDIPKGYKTAGGVDYDFKVFHDPVKAGDNHSLFDNKSHSELRMLKDGVYDKNLKNPNTAAKKHYRETLANQIRIIDVPPCTCDANDQKQGSTD